MGNQAAVNRLDDQRGSKVVAKTESATSYASEVADLIGGPSRTRTLDPLIKSDSQRVQPDDTDQLNVQQIELWPDRS
jgi:hypothetical protein